MNFKKSKKKKIWAGINFCLFIFFLSSLGVAKESQNIDKEAAMTQALLNTAKENALVETKEEKTLSEVISDDEKQEEEEALFIADIVKWVGSKDSALFEMVSEEATMPTASVTNGEDQKTVTITFSKPVAVRVKKDNEINASILRRVLLGENAVLVRKFGLKAPYYVLSTVQLFFNTPVLFETNTAENWFFVSFTRHMEDKKDKKDDIEALIDMVDNLQLPETQSVSNILGNIFETKEIYEAYMLGGGTPEDFFKKIRAIKKAPRGIFDGSIGFPQDATRIFEEAYPSFGTKEYWKKHIRAQLKQTFGFSSDFDGNYGSWGGEATRHKAWTMQPDIDVMYNGIGFGKPFYGTKKPTGSFDLRYNASRLFPVTNMLGFGDGFRSQSFSAGGNYKPNNRYSIATQNIVRFFDGKNIEKSSNGKLLRKWNKGYRTTNALGLNYRLGKRTLWKLGGGIEKTFSKSRGGKSEDKTGFLSTGIEHKFSKRFYSETTLGYSHLFYDKDSWTSRRNSNYTEGENIYSLTQDFRYTLTKRLSLQGGPDFYLIDGDLLKFGARARLRYEWRRQDMFQIGYDNAMVQNGAAKIYGGIANRASTGISLSRYEVFSASYFHSFGQNPNPKTRLGLSIEYRKNSPASGVYERQHSKENGMTFQVSLMRKLRRGLTWLELIYRYSNYHSLPTQKSSGNDISIKEHALFFVIRNYFGEWGEAI